jgi:hypothetical protein
VNGLGATSAVDEGSPSTRARIVAGNTALSVVGPARLTRRMCSASTQVVNRVASLIFNDKGSEMLSMTTWKSRPLSPDQASRMMDTWGKIEASQAENPSIERLCWYLAVDGASGVTVSSAKDIDAANAWALEVGLALGEFLEMETKTVLDLDAAMPAILKGFEYGNG